MQFITLKLETFLLSLSKGDKWLLPTKRSYPSHKTCMWGFHMWAFVKIICLNRLFKFFIVSHKKKSCIYLQKNLQFIIVYFASDGHWPPEQNPYKGH